MSIDLSGSRTLVVRVVCVRVFLIVFFLCVSVVWLSSAESEEGGATEDWLRSVGLGGEGYGCEGVALRTGHRTPPGLVASWNGEMYHVD